MNLRSFWERGGFKVLAVARLSSCSYSMVLYVLNCLVAGIEEIVSSTGELSILLGVPERLVKSAIEELSVSNILSITKKHEKTLVIRMVLDPEKWTNLRSTPERNKRMLGDAKNLHSLIPQKEIKKKSKPRKVSMSSQEALLFPKKNVNKSDKNNKEILKNTEAIDKIISAFVNYHKNEIDVNKEEKFAALLLEDHSLEQIISLINFFSKEIPSLSMLAGAWFHYMNKYREEMADVDDLNAFRKKHEGFDEKIRAMASYELKRIQKERKAITADEELLLLILMRHEQPRKQLYWALKARDKYPGLNVFLEQAKASVELT
ncbi:hypothetical protein [Fluviispira sanaruensis]|uniref:Uncharacterized protein n=1 Tax=Fluviispira sanaruensis TaxID=2493639 RepID=A0A4P2VVG1_FLUSA|nr:hypothetical protein [Fluviispira sanaruensis]BBH53525.1 hypothetical protein JCM31447_19690 [Fluviispira sanaruensis]